MGLRNTEGEKDNIKERSMLGWKQHTPKSQCTNIARGLACPMHRS